jgi:hypothetical protein
MVTQLPRPIPRQGCNARAVAKVLDDEQFDSQVAEAAIGAVRRLADRLTADLDRVDRILEVGP